MIRDSACATPTPAHAGADPVTVRMRPPVLVAAGLAVALTLTACVAPTESPATTGPTSAVEDEEPTPPPVEGVLATIVIEAGQSDEAAAIDIQTQLSNWKAAGADQFIERWTARARETGDASNQAYNAFAREYALEQSRPYFDGLLGIDSPSDLTDAATATYVTGQVTILEKNLYLVLRTGGDYDEETRLMSSSAAPTAAGRTFTLHTEIFSNAAESGAAGVIRESGWVDSTGERAVVTVTTRVDGDIELITQLSIRLDE